MKYWTPMVEKITVAASMALTGYNVIHAAAPSLPAFPAWVTTPVIGEISLVTVAGAFVLYGVYMLFVKY